MLGSGKNDIIFGRTRPRPVAFKAKAKAGPPRVQGHRILSWRTRAVLEDLISGENYDN